MEMLEGRQHFVVPVVMGVAGVWDGSNGPLLYTPEDLAASVQHWNGRPIVVYHPDMSSNGTSGAPSVFNRQRVGTVFNTRFDRNAKALKAEAWLDAGRMEAVDPRVLSAVRANKMMEVSTGLFTENKETHGMYGGKEYWGVARNHRPDHLAILPDECGACSVAMGAGLCRNSGQLGTWEPKPMQAVRMFA